jgi:polysaccharide export outer membrane protein
VRMPHSQGCVLAICMAAMLTLAAGCETIQDLFKTDEDRFLGPDIMVRNPKRSRIQPIKGGIGVADIRTDLPPNATPPTEEDATYREEEYVIGPTDLLDISIMDLMSPGVETVLRREVTDAGNVDLPLLPRRIEAKGKTQEQLKQAIMAAYKESRVLNDPVVSVSVVNRKQNMYTVLGAVMRSGPYNIIRKDMRLLEALGFAGDVLSPTCRYVFIIRPAPATKLPPSDANMLEGTPRGPEPLGPLPPEFPPGGTPASTSAPTPESAIVRKLLDPNVRPDSAPAPAPSGVRRLSAAVGGAASSAAGDEAPPPAPKGAGWDFRNGKWVRTDQGNGTAAPPTAPVRLPSSARTSSQAIDANLSPFEIWKQKEKSEGSRLIVVNYQQLMTADPRSNIVIRDNDVINVPRDVTGEFYVMGEVARPGVYSLTGRKVTVKMAVAAAGNLNQTAWPQNSILVRRIGDDQEQVIPLDIEAIFYGRATDYFLKPDDLIAVGSNWRQPFMAIFRNAFRFSYGFGFVYDRNFGSPQFGSPGLDARRFTRW